MVMAPNTPVRAGVAAVGAAAGVAALITAAAAGTNPVGAVAAAAAAAVGSMFRPRPHLLVVAAAVAMAVAMAAAGAEVMAAGTAAGNQTLAAVAAGLWPKATRERPSCRPGDLINDVACQAHSEPGRLQAFGLQTDPWNACPLACRVLPPGCIVR
jgi:hypothetical protein